jgi:phosphatidylinositol alpha 1,6-mannosyltransferase
MTVATFGLTDPAELRIALFSGNYNYVRDGANRALNRLVNYLECQIGAKVRVYSPTTDTPAFAPSGTLISVPSVALPGRSDYRLALGLPNSIRRDIENFRPNMFHLSAPDWLGQRAMQFARSLKQPVATSLHTSFETYLEFYGLHFLKTRVERYLHNFYAGSDVVLAPSPPIVADLKLQGLGNRARLWSRGVDAQAFNPAFRSLDWRRASGIGDDDIAVLFFGRLVKEKGIVEFAEIMKLAALMNIPVKPLIVGDGPAASSIRSHLPNAIFAGHLAGAELGRAVASADIFINPSKTETFGNVTLEAMASRLAVICADVPCSRSLVANGETGLLCTPSNVESYVSALSELVAQPAQRALLAANAYEGSKSHVWDNVLASVVDSYRGIMRSPNGGQIACLQAAMT